jgi:hypothetical protein
VLWFYYPCACVADGCYQCTVGINVAVTTLGSIVEFLYLHFRIFLHC